MFMLCVCVSLEHNFGLNGLKDLILKIELFQIQVRFLIQEYVALALFGISDYIKEIIDCSVIIFSHLCLFKHTYS